MVTQTLKFITEPNEQMQKSVDKMLASLRFEAYRPVLGMHVRLGDACNDDRSCQKLDYYMPAVEVCMCVYLTLPRTIF